MTKKITEHKTKQNSGIKQRAYKVDEQSTSEEIA